MLPRRQRNRRDKGRVVQTLATRKALAAESGAALLAPFRSCSCKHQLGSPFSREREGGSSFLGHRVPGSANAGDTSPWLRAKRATRPPVPSCPRPFWPEQGTGLLPAWLCSCPRKELQGPKLEVTTGAGSGEENSLPEIQSHPGLASGTRRGCQAWGGREEDVTRRQLKVQAPGELEQLQHSPGTGSWQHRQSERAAGTAWAGSTPGANPAG